jgi:predicted DCC family thiol-disulfide oxidoreductase YuxK
MEMQTNQNDIKLPLLIFDGECSLCNRFANSISRYDSTSHISLKSLHEESIYGQLPYLEKSECSKSIHLVIDEGNVLKGPQVLEHLIKLNPAIKKISWLIESNAGQKAMNIFYNSANLYRESLLNRCPKCKNR